MTFSHSEQLLNPAFDARLRWFAFSIRCCKLEKAEVNSDCLTHGEICPDADMNCTAQGGKKFLKKEEKSWLLLTCISPQMCLLLSSVTANKGTLTFLQLCKETVRIWIHFSCECTQLKWDVVFYLCSLLSWLGTWDTSALWVMISQFRWMKKSCTWPARSWVQPLASFQ